MAIKDMFAHRKGRLKSRVVKTWENDYKRQILSGVVFCDSANSENVPRNMLDKVRANPEAVEIAVDTVIGWLNSPVGREFISEAFRVKIPASDPKGTE